MPFDKAFFATSSPTAVEASQLAALDFKEAFKSLSKVDAAHIVLWASSSII